MSLGPTLSLALDTLRLRKHVAIHSFENHLFVLSRKTCETVKVLGDGEHALLGAVVEQGCVRCRRGGFRERWVLNRHDERGQRLPVNAQSEHTQLATQSYVGIGRKEG